MCLLHTLISVNESIHYRVKSAMFFQISRTEFEVSMLRGCGLAHYINSNSFDVFKSLHAYTRKARSGCLNLDKLYYDCPES